MNLSAEIARLQLRSLPETVAKRVLLRDDIISLARMGSAEVGVIGRFYFSDIRFALSKADFGIPVDVPHRRGEGAIILRRVETGLHSVRVADGPEVVLPELALLDPSECVRLGGYSEMAKRARPSWPNRFTWRNILLERPLSDSEFGSVIIELQHIAGQELSRIKSVIIGGSIGVPDLIPDNRYYYESLIGPISIDIPVKEYISQKLTPYLESVLKIDANWGLRCLQCASICPEVDVAAIAWSISREDLIAALVHAGPGITPYAKLTTILISLAQATVDPQLDDMKEEALSRLLMQGAIEADSADQDELFLAFVRLTLNRISLSEQLCHATPYWRRLAAFAHATMLIETLDFADWDKSELISWCDSRQSMETAATGILDLIRTPLWRVDLYSATDINIAAIIRGTNWTPDGKDLIPSLSSTHAQEIEALFPKLRLAYGLTGPISEGKHPSVSQFIGEELLQGFFRGESDALPLNTYQTWNALSYSGRIFTFSSELRCTVREMAREFHLGDPTISEDQFAQISCAAELAALQSDDELAGILVSCILSAAEHLDQPIDAARCAAILVMASGSTENWQSGLARASDRLVALAYRVPRGACAEELAAWIETMQRFIRLEERRWGKAWIISRSAIH